MVTHTLQKMLSRCALLFFLQMMGTAADKPNGNSTNAKELDPFEESVVNSMIRMVDEKFNSLSTRMSSVERSLNNLQYYNLRQFRVVNTHLHALDTLLQAIHSQIGQQEIGTKEMATSVSLLKREVKNMEMLNNQGFEDMEREFSRLSKDVTKRIGNMETNVISSLNESKDSENSIKLITGAMATELSRAQNTCVEAIARTEEKVDDLHNITSFKLDKIVEGVESENDNKTEVRHLMTRLTEVNDNVLQSISFYRHTGDLVERIVGATETVADDQDKIRDDIRYFLELQTNNTFKMNDLPETDIPNEIKNEINENLMSDQNNVKCDIASMVLDNVMQVLKNGSYMLELSTDIAQMSQYSLKNLQFQLSQEISNLKDVANTIENRTKSQPQPAELLTGLMEFNIEELSNTTKAIFHMTEAIASNTGWIPYIFTNLQFVEIQVNESIRTGRELYKKVMQNKVPVKPTQATKSVISNEIVEETKQVVKPLDNNTEDTIKSTLESFMADLMEDSNVTDVIRKIDSVFLTNQRVQRLVPALTRLLGEPEPFITLVDGNRENEGRVEIYKMGRWGTLCDPLTHTKAAYICRHLGFLGGVTTRPGYFGPGVGTFWKLNYTCLYSRQCPIAIPVLSEGECSHESDFGVICDKMIRLTYESVDDEPVRRSEGFLEMYNNDGWRPVCSDTWVAENTRVVCRQLGFGSGITVTNTSHAEEYNTGTDSTITGTKCIGNEFRLDLCSHGKLSRTACTSKKPVYLFCN